MILKSLPPLADVIILAVPIKQTMAYLKELADLDLKDNVIITDAGSTKREIVEAAERYLTGKNVQFVGSHPMAGSHKSGAIAADVTLFENAYYIFTPTSLTKETTIPELKDILSGLKSRYVEIDAAEHDRVTSQISHFPHLLASGLMEQAADYAQAHEMTNHFAAGGFRDMTRIAESEPGMWASILMTNGPAVLDRIEDFKKRLDHVADLIKAEDESAIWEFFDNGHPFAGQEGKFVTSRHLRDRLFLELNTDVSLRVEDTDDMDSFKVSGRGELHLSVLIENMRREGYEFAVSKAEVLYKEDENGKLLEPMELVYIDVPDEFTGTVIDKLSQRKGELRNMGMSNGAYTRLEFSIPSRGLIGYRGDS